jgi:hypothetical protein
MRCRAARQNRGLIVSLPRGLGGTYEGAGGLKSLFQPVLPGTWVTLLGIAFAAETRVCKHGSIEYLVHARPFMDRTVARTIVWESLKKMCRDGTHYFPVAINENSSVWRRVRPTRGANS